ncbi:MAG: CoA pyrophosphatase [Clostridiales Family XIII bacterium]|jgi:8-oxo-dGTP pyrophosphatase MutT (NUDIX family)|nr:CoA pyrophosphatase [Clostridiales Family XIII bacterium]
MKIPALDAIKNAARANTPKPIGEYRYYSVLLPLVFHGGALHVLYELRSPDLDVQPGEVSFPGGAIEAGETPRDAALRETVEELGISADGVEIVGELDYLITYSNFTLYCFLGVLDADALAKAVPSAAEVAEYFLVPLKWLIENEPEVYVNRVVPEPAKDLPFEKLSPRGDYNWRKGFSTVMIYTWPGQVTCEAAGAEMGEAADKAPGGTRVIWGLTARLTKSFVDLIRDV